MKQFLTTLTLCFSASLLCAADDQRPKLCADVDPGPYVLSLDLANLLEMAATSKPTSIWWDPACQSQREYATKQIKLLQKIENEMPPLIETLAEAKAGLFIGYDQPPGLNIRDPLLIFLADLGASQKDWHEWLHKQINRGGKINLDEQSGVINGYSGFYEKKDPARRQESAFFGFKENNMLVGMVPAIKDPAAGIDPNSLPKTPVTLQIDGSKLFERMKFVSENAGWDPFDFKDWGFLTTGMNPKAKITIIPKEKGWEGDIELEGLGAYKCNPLSDAILKTIPSGSVLWWAENIDVQHIAKQIAPKFSDREKAQVQALLGTDVNGAAAWLTGNMSFALKPAAIIPEMTLTLEITNEDVAVKLMNQFFAQFAQPTPVAGTKASWQILGAMPMIISVGVGDGKIVVSNNAVNISSVMTGENLIDTSVAKGCVAYSYMDLPTIGQTYLPMVWGMLKSTKEKMARTGLDAVRWEVRNLFRRANETGAINRDSIDKALKNVWRRQRLEALFQPETDLAQNILDNFSVWKDPDDKNNYIVFARTQHGYEDMNSWNGETLSAEGVEGRIGNKKKISGPDIPNIPVINVEDPPMFDGNWIPDLPVVIKHLPVYEVSATSSEAGKLHIKEKGLPLASFFGGMIASVVWFETADRYASATRNAKRKAQEANEQKAIEVKVEAVDEKVDDF